MNVLVKVINGEEECLTLVETCYAELHIDDLEIRGHERKERKREISERICMKFNNKRISNEGKKEGRKER